MLCLAIDNLAIMKNNVFTDMARSPEDEKIIQDFRTVFEAALKERGWNQAKVCRAVNKSPAWLSRILSGARGMDVLDLIKIANILKISPERLLPKSPFTKENEAEEMIRKLREVLTPEQYNRLIELGPKK